VQPKATGDSVRSRRKCKLSFVYGLSCKSDRYLNFDHVEDIKAAHCGTNLAEERFIYSVNDGSQDAASRHLRAPEEHK
jgi:hypothetical protein